MHGYGLKSGIPLEGLELEPQHGITRLLFARNHVKQIRDMPCSPMTRNSDYDHQMIVKVYREDRKDIIAPAPSVPCLVFNMGR